MGTPYPSVESYTWFLVFHSTLLTHIARSIVLLTIDSPPTIDRTPYVLCGMVLYRTMITSLWYHTILYHTYLFLPYYHIIIK